MRNIKFGFLGLGRMAHKMAEAIETVDNAELIAAGSRFKDKALAFGEKYDLPGEKCYEGYDNLVADSDVDVVYIATPVSTHKELTFMCADNDKAVLCEKSVAENSESIKKMIEKCRENDVFFMEAMWTRYLPVYRNIRNWLDEKRIGDIRIIEADICIWDKLESEDIRYKPELGGGALLDLGIYPVSLFSFIYGEQPETVKSVVSMDDTGVDEQLAASFSYGDGRLANMYCSLFAKSPGKAVIVGTEGRIEINRFWYSERAQLFVDGQQVELVNRPHKCNGYEYELEEVVKCLTEEKRESDIIPVRESIKIMETMDKVRESWK